jgi:hypothetical protein
MQVQYDFIHVQNITIYYIPVCAPKKKSNTIATPNAKARNNVLWQTESQ